MARKLLVRIDTHITLLIIDADNIFPFIRIAVILEFLHFLILDTLLGNDVVGVFICKESGYLFIGKSEERLKCLHRCFLLLVELHDIRRF